MFLAILARQWLSMQEKISVHFTHCCGTAASLSPSRNSAKGIISPAHITDERPTENTFSAGLPWKKFLANGINHLYCCVRCEGFPCTAQHSKGCKDKPAVHSQLLRMRRIWFPVFVQLIWDGMQSFASGLYFIGSNPEDDENCPNSLWLVFVLLYPHTILFLVGNKSWNVTEGFKTYS